MESKSASLVFTTLGHEGRLAVFRFLMRRAPVGARPTEIAEVLGLKQNTLSHYLSDLENVGLVTVRRDGRNLHYAPDTQTLGTLLSYLAVDCGRGRPDVLDRLPHHQDTQQRPMNVLFICSGNSARSIFAEAILRDLGGNRFQAFSAGTRPGAQLNPFALEVLKRNGHDIGGLRSKHLSEFQTGDAPHFDFVFTVCDTAAAEDCAPWSGTRISGHWGLPDPVKAEGTDAEKALAFATTYAALYRRISAFVDLPLSQLGRAALQKAVDAIAFPKS